MTERELRRTDPARYLPPHPRSPHCSDKCKHIEPPLTLLDEETE